MINKPIVRNQVPREFKTSYPRFILFLEKYYEWLYRGSGLSSKEIELLRKDTSWLRADIDKFIDSGDIKYVDKNQINMIDQAILELNTTKNSGFHAKNLQDAFMLEDSSDKFITSDGLQFADKDGAWIETSNLDPLSTDEWFSSFGIPEFTTKSNIIAGVDKSLLVSLMKHIYAIKGTEMSMKLFFNLCFDENVVIYQPKQNIAVIDDNWIIDDIYVIRDDELYQEFSYVIVVNDSISKYQEIFDTIYRSLIHPAGFRVAIVNKADFKPGGLF